MHIDPQVVVTLYRAMVLTRTFDARAVALQRTGKLGTFASSLGQEAISVGIGSAMADDDVLVPSYREHGAQFMRGMPMQNTLLYWGGDERGSEIAHWLLFTTSTSGTFHTPAMFMPS